MPTSQGKGSPNATEYWEAMQVFKLAELSKNDMFYDLGCGHGRVCIWASSRCGFSLGIERDHRRATIAKNRVERRQLVNVKIIEGDFQEFLEFRRKNAVFFCIEEIRFPYLRMLNRLRGKNLRVVTLGPPPIPIKPVKRKGAYYLTLLPYTTAKSGVIRSLESSSLAKSSLSRRYVK